MFGHQDPNDPNNNQAADGTPDLTLDAPSTPAATTDSSSAPSAPAVQTDDTAGDYIVTDPPAPASTPPTSLPTVTTGASTDTNDTPTSVQAPAASTDELLDLKQNALQQLTPLLGHLDQTPEEKFRTTMMMIQAADNQALLKTAYEAAQDIPDEKVRAQALLDVVNEINYFTQQQQDAAA